MANFSIELALWTAGVDGRVRGNDKTGELGGIGGLRVNGTSGDDGYTYAQVSAGILQWRTIERAAWGSNSESAKVAGEAAQAGDLVSVEAGTYSIAALTTGSNFNDSYTPIYNPVNSGTAGNYIEFRANGTVNLQLTGVARPIMGAEAKDYIKWRGFSITASDIVARIGTGINTARDANFIEFHENAIIGEAQVVNDNYAAFMMHTNDGCLIKNNAVRGLIDTGSPGHNTCMVMTYSATNLTIEHNETNDCNAAIYIKGEEGGNLQSNITIRYNEMWDCYNFLEIGACAGTGGTNYCYQNLARDYKNDVGGDQHFLHTEGAIRDWFIVNNTFSVTDVGWDILYPGDAFDTVFTNCVIQNNITANVTTGSAIGFHAGAKPNLSGLTIDFNNYYNVTTVGHLNSTNEATLAVWRTATGQEAGSNISNPTFINSAADDYRLDTGSTLLSGQADDGVDIANLLGGGTSAPINLGCYISAGQTEEIGIEASP